ncbi:MAG: AbrB/MazE/SpoVT family DNA-binding domain-containing protein [Acidobacteriaceae bacterium]
MHKSSLRKVGGSVMLVVPPVLLDLLRLKAGERVGVTVENGRLIVEPQSRPHYTLAELLAETDASPAATEREWVDAPRAGGELL